MNGKAVSILLVAGVCACHKHEDTTKAVATTDVPPSASTTNVVASPAPSETVAAAVSASAAPSSSDEVRLARQAALREAAEYGLIGLLGADSGAPTAPWGRDDSLGTEPLVARGNIFGNGMGDSFGAGGLGVSVDGGGGSGDGIGLGNVGTLGHGSGTGTGQGFGNGYGRLGGASTHSPKLRQGAITVNGRLPPEVIQRIVRQNFGRFRLCYENGLRSDSKLAGTVATKFVIGADGSVTSTARDNSTTMTDSGVVSCVTRAFSNLSFPQPEGGIVVVVFPVIFAPAD